MPALPRPERTGALSLEEALARRRSVREFGGRPLTDREISQLLWAAQGLTGPDGERTAPSAGALYPLEVFVATASGFFHYDLSRHGLRRRSGDDLRPGMAEAALSQDAVREAAAVFVIAARPARTAAKYGAARARRYVQLEAGHAAQNLLLEATALGLGAVPVGAFHDARLRQLLDLPPDSEVLYLIPTGAPPS
jgi:SagB-type dehydrogenase family enzyme